MNQVHKENLTTVDNALPNRSAPDMEIFGMEGIPEDILQAHNQRISHEFFAAEAERRAMTGNPGPGAGSNKPQGTGVKKPKFESPADLKKRLAEHKAKKAAAEANGSISSDPNTPAVSSSFPSDNMCNSANHINQTGSATPPVFNAPFPAPTAASPQQATFPQPYAPHPVPVPAPPFYGTQQSPPYVYGEAFGGAPPPVGAFPPGQFPPQPQFSPPPQQAMTPGYPYQGFPLPGGPGPAGLPHSGSPFNPPYNQRGPPPANPPVQQQPPAQQRQNSLPAAPGLPQRPNFNAPHVSREQLAEMHQGNVHAAGEQQTQPFTSQASANATAQSVDELISSAEAHAAQNQSQTPVAVTPTPAPEKPASAEKKADGEGKKAKKEARLVYSDQETSPEEKMSAIPKYHFTPDKGGEMYLGPVEAAVTGPVQDADTILDPQDR